MKWNIPIPNQPTAISNGLEYSNLKAPMKSKNMMKKKIKKWLWKYSILKSEIIEIIKSEIKHLGMKVSK